MASKFSSPAIQRSYSQGGHGYGRTQRGPRLFTHCGSGRFRSCQTRPVLSSGKWFRSTRPLDQAILLVRAQSLEGFCLLAWPLDHDALDIRFLAETKMHDLA